MSLSQRWANIVNDLREQGRYRQLKPPAGIDFTSNDYLGYAGMKRAPISVSDNALSISGASSRLLRGHHAIWDEVEAALAAWHGAEAALMMTSGFMANKGLLATIIQPTDWVASDRLNHASIIDGLRLSKAERYIYEHNDLNHLEDGLRAAAEKRRRDQELFIATESLFSMEGDAASLPALVEFAERYDAHVIVDEAHATGCFGDAGGGLVDALGLRQRVLATVHTGGKALGVLGAYICGSRQLREFLVNCCRQLIYTTALPSIAGAWWLQRLAFVRNDDEGRRALHDNTEIFRRLLTGHGIESSGADFIVPIHIGDERNAVTFAETLQAAGFDIRAVRPPTVPPGSSRLRLSIHADHSRLDLEQAAAAIATVLNHALELSK